MVHSKDVTIYTFKIIFMNQSDSMMSFLTYKLYVYVSWYESKWWYKSIRYDKQTRFGRPPPVWMGSDVRWMETFELNETGSLQINIIMLNHRKNSHASKSWTKKMVLVMFFTGFICKLKVKLLLHWLIITLRELVRENYVSLVWKIL